jgi:hypothetical protein
MRQVRITPRLRSLLVGLATAAVLTGAFGCTDKSVGRYQLVNVDSNYQYLLDTSTGDIYMVYGDTIRGPIRLSEATPFHNSTPTEGAK